MDQSSKAAQARISELERLVSRLRHDLRGALSPALLMADRLQMQKDPVAQRASEVIGRTVDRITEILDATRAAVPSRGADIAAHRQDCMPPSVP